MTFKIFEARMIRFYAKIFRTFHKYYVQLFYDLSLIKILTTMGHSYMVAPKIILNSTKGETKLHKVIQLWSF